MVRVARSEWPEALGIWERALANDSERSAPFRFRSKLRGQRDNLRLEVDLGALDVFGGLNELFAGGVAKKELAHNGRAALDLG